MFDKEKLAKLKELHQQMKEKLEKIKNDQTIDTSSDLMSEYINLIDPMVALVKKYGGELEDLQLEPLLKKTKGFLEKTKGFVDTTNDDLFEQIKDLEEKLKQNEKLINFLEEQQAEL